MNIRKLTDIINANVSMGGIYRAEHWSAVRELIRDGEYGQALCRLNPDDTDGEEQLLVVAYAIRKAYSHRVITGNTIPKERL